MTQTSSSLALLTALRPWVIFAAGTLLVAPLNAATADAASPTTTPSECVGDCGNTGRVTANDVLDMLVIALALDNATTCVAGDASQDGTITIDEILKAVNLAVTRCPLTGPAATEASAGIEASTRDGVFQIIDFGFVSSTGQAALRHQLKATGGGASLPSCPDGGSVEVVSCDSNGSMRTLAAVLSECRSIDPQTQVITTRTGTLKQTVAVADFCVTHEAPPETPIKSEFIHFTEVVSDAGVETTTQIEQLTDFVEPGGQGCNGPNGSDSVNGSLTVRGGVNNADRSYTYGNPLGDDFVVETQSISGPEGCVVRQTVNGTLTVDDRTIGRRFSETSRNFVITSQVVGALREVTEEGGLAVDCLGESQFRTIEPLQTDPRASCPFAGVLEVTLPDGSVSRTRFSANGVAFDFNGDGRIDKLVADCVGSAVTQCAGTIPAPQILAFVANTGGDDTAPDTVSIIDTNARFVIGTTLVGDAPTSIAAAPNGSFVYVTNNGSNTVSVIDTASFRLVSTVPVDSFPVAVAFSPNGGLAYVASGSPNMLSVIDTAKALSNPANSVIARAVAGNLSTGLAVTPDARFVYLTNSGSDQTPGNTVSLVDARKIFSDPANAVTAMIPVGLSPASIAITPDGRLAYVTNRGTRSLVGNTISVIETSSHTVTSVTVGSVPSGVAVSPAGTLLYVANSGTPNSVSVINTTTNAVDQTILFGGNDDDPFFVAFTPDGKSAYVTNNFSSSVSVIDTATQEVSPRIPVGALPRGVTITSAPARLPAGTVTAAGFGSVTLGTFADIAAGPDGNLWFAQPGANSVGRITPGGNVTEFPIPTLGSMPAAITAGPDANLWFTEQATNKIGRITLDGEITEFATSPTAPTAITSGADGNLWFTQRGTKRVARITPSGSIIEFTTPGISAVAPRGITATPDGGLWFTEPALNQIGRLAVSGQVQVFPVTTPDSSPAFITLGPDGSVWFTEQHANQIGRISINGELTELAIPTSDSQPGAIAAGIDGNLWFTEQNANQIGRITPGGTITEFPVPTPAFGITTAHDGNLWFTLPGANRIAQISAGTLVTVP